MCLGLCHICFVCFFVFIGICVVVVKCERGNVLCICVNSTVCVYSAMSCLIV